MFNGHKNWNHWNVSLWIRNDGGLYCYAVELCRKHGKDRAAHIMLDGLPRETPDGAPYTYSSVRAAFRGL